MASPPGNLLAGRYRTLKRLGSGGMATVLLAEDERLGRQVAVKRMHAESPEDVAKRFRREAQLGASLNHPNIVSVFDIGTDPETVLIVMEYVPGGTLKDALARGPLPREAAFKLLRGVAAAVDHSHEHDVVHRDIKPANILLDADGRAKLADLGIATAAEVTSITNTGAVLGTASYMPPERLDGQPGGKEADIYALATVAYETLTGRKARQGRSAVEIAAAVMSEPPPDLRVHVPDAPEEAARVLERGMARDPSERPASAGELIHDLCRAFEGQEEAEATTPLPPEPAPARAPAPAPTYVPQRTERRWLLPVLGLLVALVAVVVVLLIAGGGDESSDTPRSTPQAAGAGTTAQDPTIDVTPRPSDVDPKQAVADFYTSAADGEFEQAWKLAGPGLREQLGGYDSFVNTLQTLESIDFPKLETTVKSDDRATVELRSVAKHTDRTDNCSGTAELTWSSDAWLIDHLSVDCNQGASGGGAPPQVTPGKGPAGGRPIPPGQEKKKDKKPKKEK